MDSFQLKSLEKPIKWKDNSPVQEEQIKKIDLPFDWNEVEVLYQQCQSCNLGSNVTNQCKESVQNEINIKTKNLLHKTHQSSASDLLCSDCTQEINDCFNQELKKDSDLKLIQHPPYKRSATALKSRNKSFTDLHCDSSIFRKYRVSKKSLRTFSMINFKRSLITPLLKQPLMNRQRNVEIFYLDSNFSKTFLVDHEMLACELIVLAIKEFKNTHNFDQSILKYANFSLAYQLISFEEYCDFSAFSSKQHSFRASYSVANQEFQYVKDENSNKDMDRRIEFDLGTKISFKKLTLVESEVNFGLDLQLVEKTLQQDPNMIILLIEDSKNEIFYHIKCSQNDTLFDIFNKVSKRLGQKTLKTDFYFTLKFQCVNLDQKEPLHMQFPINRLPIHWLVLQSKFDVTDVATQSSLNLRDSNASVPRLYSIRSQHFLFNESLDRKKNEFFSNYNYQEFSVIKLENDECKNLVKIGIDYFDFYYYYIGRRIKKFSFYRVAQSISKFILQNSNSGQIKETKRIPNISIIEILQGETHFELTYLKQNEVKKTIKFKLSSNQQLDNNPKNISEITNKLKFIIQERRKEFTQQEYFKD